jgi:hypothetical protein
MRLINFEIESRALRFTSTSLPAATIPSDRFPHAPDEHDANPSFRARLQRVTRLAPFVQSRNRSRRGAANGRLGSSSIDAARRSPSIERLRKHLWKNFDARARGRAE